MSGCDFVTLRPTLLVPFDALDIVLDLERRGIQLERSADGSTITARPRALLTDADREAVRHWRLHINEILAYVAEATRQ